MELWWTLCFPFLLLAWRPAIGTPPPCSEDELGDVGLEDEGRLVVCNGSMWGMVCSDEFETVEAQVACKQLGFSRFNPRIKRYWELDLYTGNHLVIIDEFECTGSEERLVDCNTVAPALCDHSRDVALECSPRRCEEFGIRLAGGNTTHQGRVEICLEEEWTSLCSEDWSSSNTRVLCHQLGHSSQGAGVVATIPGASDALPYSQQFSCEGDEENLFNCSHSSPDSTECSHSNDLTIRCSLKVCEDGDIQLADGLSPYEGRLEFCQNNTWRTWCSENDWHNYETKVVCRELGFGIEHKALLPDNHYPAPPNTPINDRGINCEGNESDLEECRDRPYTVNCNHDMDVNIRCGQCAENNVTLTPAGGGHMRVEMCLNGRWGTVCGDGWWDNNDALVLCRQFDLDNTGAQLSIRRSFSDLSHLPVIVEGVSCTGGESHFQNCNYSLSHGVCPAGKIAGVQCSAPVIPTPAALPSLVPAGVASTSVSSPSSSLPAVSSPSDPPETAVSSHTRGSTVEYCHFQLVFEGNIVCYEWLQHDASTKLDTLLEGVVRGLERKCGCGLTLSSVTHQQPHCLQQDQFLLPGLLTGTNSTGCGKIMELLSNWAKEESEVIVGGVRLTTVKGCSVYREPGKTLLCNPTPTEEPTKSLLEVILLPGIISVLAAIILLALIIIVLCFILVRVQRRKANVRLSEATTNAYNMVAIGEQPTPDDSKIIEIYDSADSCTAGIYERIREPLPPIPPPEDDGYPPVTADKPYLTTTFKPTTKDNHTGQQYKATNAEQNGKPGACMYPHIDVEDDASEDRGSDEYDEPPLEDSTANSHYQPLHLAPVPEPPVDGARNTVENSHYQPLQLMTGDPGAEYDCPPLDGTANSSHYQPLELVSRDPGGQDTYTLPQTFLPPATTVPASGEARGTQSSGCNRNYQQLLIQEDKGNGEYASLNI